MQEREEGRGRVRVGGVDGFVGEGGGVEPLGQVFEGVWAVGGEGDGVGVGFEEGGGRGEAGGEEGGVVG